MEAKEMGFEIFLEPVQHGNIDEIEEEVKMISHHGAKGVKGSSWMNPLMRKIGYDTSVLGPVVNPRLSERVFDDARKFKLTIEEKIAVMKKSRVELSKVFEKVNDTMKDKKRFPSSLNARVRLSHASPNRFEAFRYNTPMSMVSVITKMYNGLLEKIADSEIVFLTDE